MNLAVDLEVQELKMQELLPDNVIDALESQVIFPNSGLNPTLGVIIKENDGSDSRSYLRAIQQKGKKYNANVDVREVKDAAEAADAINNLKNNPGVFGIINLSRFGGADRALNDMIPVRLDIDCASSYTLGMLMANASNIGYRLAPCAAVACYKLLEYHYLGGDLAGANIAILGRSLRVGRPLAEILCQKDATVTVMHSKSKIHEQELWNYDIVISAMGAPEEIGYFDLVLEEEYDSGSHTIHPDIVIDVGMGVKDGKICGDVTRVFLDDIDYMRITPTIGGVGKLATVVLFSKLFTNAAKTRGIDI